jgi:predicted nucleic acid-binding protein
LNVLDASAVIDLLLQAGRVPEIRSAAAMPIAAPVILDFEVMNVLRCQIQSKTVSQQRAQSAYEAYFDLHIRRFETTLIADRIWKLRNNFTAYDAAYIALAEALSVPLLTRDKKLVNKPGHKAEVRLIELPQ